jgi:hypothetical protein
VLEYPERQVELHITGYYNKLQKLTTHLGNQQCHWIMINGLTQSPATRLIDLMVDSPFHLIRNPFILTTSFPKIHNNIILALISWLSQRFSDQVLSLFLASSISAVFHPVVTALT